MTSYRRVILPLVLIGGAALASVFATLMVRHRQAKEQGRQKVELDGWENEGGSVAATAATALAEVST